MVLQDIVRRLEMQDGGTRWANASGSTAANHVLNKGAAMRLCARVSGGGLADEEALQFNSDGFQQCFSKEIR
jgi:hypothetical protein